MKKPAFCVALSYAISLCLLLCLIPGCCWNDCGLKCKPCNKVYYRKKKSKHTMLQITEFDEEFLVASR